MIAPGQEKEPCKSDAPSKIVKEQVRVRWRLSGDRLLRIAGKAKALDAHTLLCEDGTEVDLNGGMDAPELAAHPALRAPLRCCRLLLVRGIAGSPLLAGR